jgi:hypothetical protein
MNESKKPGSRYQHQRARIELTDRGFSVEDINRIEVSWMQPPRVTVGLGESKTVSPGGSVSNYARSLEPEPIVLKVPLFLDRKCRPTSYVQGNYGPVKICLLMAVHEGHIEDEANDPCLGFTACFSTEPPVDVVTTELQVGGRRYQVTVNGDPDPIDVFESFRSWLKDNFGADTPIFCWAEDIAYHDVS